MMKPENMKLLSDYVQCLHGSTIPYERRGKYVDAVWFFLCNTDSVDKRGYRQLCKQHSAYLVANQHIKDGILHFLAIKGIGYRKTVIKKASTSKLQLTKIDQRKKETINGFLVWLQENNDYSPNTLTCYEFGIRNFYSYFDQFSQDNCRRFISHLESNGFKPQTINLRITALEKMGEYLHKSVHLKRPKMKRSLHTDNVPTEKEYKRICDYLKDRPEWLMIVKLMATTGCRFSELAQFTYEQVASGNCMLKGKGDKYRQFYFNKEMQNMAKDKEGKILTITDRGLNERLKSIGEKLGINKRKMHPHAFRHFFAKMYLKKTNDVIGLADLLGHGSIDTTRIYLQKSYDEQQKSFNRTVEW